MMCLKLELVSFSSLRVKSFLLFFLFVLIFLVDITLCIAYMYQQIAEF